MLSYSPPIRGLLLSAFLLLSIAAIGQSGTRQVQVKQAGELIGNSRKNMSKLIGDVIFEHEGALMYCDSAYLFDDNSLKANGNVHIDQGDTIHLYGDSLLYDGNTQLARFRGNVKLIENDMTLTTNYLDYDRKNSQAYYYDGGRIVSNADKNTLTSKIGYYFPDTREFFFKDSVLLVHPNYTIESDTLKYNTDTEVTYFYGPSTITSDSNLIYCENGWYDTKKDQAEFKKNAYIINKAQRLAGDSIWYDRNIGVGRAFGNVAISDSIEDYTVTGDFAEHYEKDSISVVTGNMLLTQLFGKDTFYLHGDSLHANYDSTRQHRMLYAFHKVKFFKSDMQGKCDSLVFSTLDSTIRMFRDPIIWSDESQITADSITIVSYDGKIHSMNMDHDAFIISMEDSVKYNQIKGKNMIGYFKDSHLKKVRAIGNGETIYYAREEDGTMIGVNKAVCSELIVAIDSSKVSNITFLQKPAATLYPLNEISPKELILKGFYWYGEDRPMKKEDIFIWRTETIEPEKPKDSSNGKEMYPKKVTEPEKSKDSSDGKEIEPKEVTEPETGTEVESDNEKEAVTKPKQDTKSGGRRQPTKPE